MKIVLIVVILLIGGPVLSADLSPYDNVITLQFHMVRQKIHHPPKPPRPHHKKPPRRVMNLRVKINP
jgi:hypothetical protein